MEEFSEMSSSNEVNSQAQPKNTQTNLEGEQLREAILNQVEFYFSRENLSSDHYLVSNMDNDYYVSLATIANFSKVKALTSDLSLIVDVLSTSKVVSLDDTKTKIKPANISQRSTLILRDMGDATEEDIVALLVSDQLPDPTEIKTEIGSTWCVTYNNKETTLLAISILKQKIFNDKPLRVGIKTENILKSCNMFRIPDSKIPLQYPWVPKGAWMGPSGRGYWDPSFVPDDREKDPNRAGGRGGYKKRKEYPAGSRKPHYSTNNNNNNNNNNGDKRRPRKKGRDGKKQTPFQLAPAQFPPLPSVKKDRKGGYQSEFIKYSQEEIINAIQALGELPRPEGFPDDAVVITEKPNLSLETTKPLPEEDPKTLCDVIKQKPKKEAKPPKRNNNSNNNNNNNSNNKSKDEKEAKPAVEAKSGHKAEGSPSASRKKPTWSQIVVPKTNNGSGAASSSGGGAKGKPANKNVNNNNKKNNNSKNENNKNNSNDKSDDNVAVVPAAESKNENPNPQVENRAAEEPSKIEESNPSSKDEQQQ